MCDQSLILEEVRTLKIDINFDELLNESVNAAIDATVSCSECNPDSASTNEQLFHVYLIWFSFLNIYCKKIYWYIFFFYIENIT